MAAVGQMLEEGKAAGQQADSSLAKIYWTIGDKLKEAGLIGRDHYGESVIEQLGCVKIVGVNSLGYTLVEIK